MRYVKVILIMGLAVLMMACNNGNDKNYLRRVLSYVPRSEAKTIALTY